MSTTPTQGGFTIDDIDERTTRAVMYARLRQAASLLHLRQDEKLGRLQEIEENVRKKWSGRQQDVVQLLVSSTVPEWAEVVDFLDNFGDLLPIALHRVHEGAKQATEPEQTV